MKEYMLLIRNEIDHQAGWPPERHQEFLNKCEMYISNLNKEGKLLSAQPLVREGRMISGSKGAWKDKPFNEAKEVIVGYYHILAEDINGAIDVFGKDVIIADNDLLGFIEWLVLPCPF